MVEVGRTMMTDPKPILVDEPTAGLAVTLANGIEGYFTESVCGANCSDATVLWICNGFQYLVGLKAGRQSDVLNLANAIIENSIPWPIEVTLRAVHGCWRFNTSLPTRVPFAVFARRLACCRLDSIA